MLEEKLDRIEEKFERIEKALQEMANKQVTDLQSNNKVLIGAAATVIAGLRQLLCYYF